MTFGISCRWTWRRISSKTRCAFPQTKKQEKVIVFTTDISENLENTIKKMKNIGYKFQVKGYDIQKLDIKILNTVKHYLGNDFKVKEIIITKE